MARKRSRARKHARGSGAETKPRTVSEGVRVQAVRASSGRAATTVHVEVEPERLRRQLDRFDDVERVVAELPTEEDGAGVRWDEQRLDKTSEDVGPTGERKLRYSGTRYDACDATRYGVGVRLDAPGGPVRVEGKVDVREADKPGGGAGDDRDGA